MVIFMILTMIPLKSVFCNDSGIVVGRAVLKLDGFQDEHREMVAPFKLKIACWKQDEYGEYYDETYNVQADTNGVFLLKDISVGGYFRIAVLTLPGQKEFAIPSPIKSPKKYKGQGKMIPIIFSAEKPQTPIPVLNMGTTTFALDKEGNISLQINNESHERIKSKDGYEFNDVEPDFVLLEYAARISNRYSREIDFYIKDRKAYYQADKIFNTAKKESSGSQKVSLLQNALKIYPGHTNAIKALATAYVNNGNIEAAIQVAKQGISNAHNNSAIYQLLVDLLIRTGDSQQAMTMANEYLQLNPGRTLSYVLVSKVYLENNKLGQAEAILSDCFGKVKYYDKYKDAAQIMIEYNYPEKALEYFRSYQQLKPYDAWANINLAYGYLLNDMDDDAVELLKTIPEAEVYYHVSIRARALKKYNLARTFARKSLEYYNDGTLSMSEEELKQYVDRTERSAEFENYWITYLKKIQDENDYKNWNGKPYDAYIN